MDNTYFPATITSEYYSDHVFFKQFQRHIFQDKTMKNFYSETITYFITLLYKTEMYMHMNEKTCKFLKNNTLMLKVHECISDYIVVYQKKTKINLLIN